MAAPSKVSDETVGKALAAALGHRPEVQATTAYQVEFPAAFGRQRAALEAVWEPTVSPEDASLLLAALSGSSYWHLAEGETVGRLEALRLRLEAIRDGK